LKRKQIGSLNCFEYWIQAPPPKTIGAIPIHTRDIRGKYMTGKEIY